MHTLKSQIILALSILAALFAMAILYALQVVDRQRQDDHLTRMGSELRLLQQQISMQAMNYKENAPRDYTSYYRDTRLYYQELLANRERLAGIIDAFAQQRLPRAQHSHHDMEGALDLSGHNQQLALALKTAWDDFNNKLENRLGNPEEPRLEWGAEWILAQHPLLENATATFLESLEQEIEARTSQAHNVGRLLLTTGLIVALLIVLWFYQRVLRPLENAVGGFKQVATGDFSYRVKNDSNNEIGWLIGAFNQLTDRLDALLQLLTRLQQTKTLDESLEMLSKVLPRLVPIDWAGMLLLGPDGSMKLERAYSDGSPENLPEQAFQLQGTLLDECLRSGSPLHIPNVDDTARMETRYRFLSLLAKRGRRDAVFMPILGNEPRVGVLVLASRHTNSYKPEQVRLLHNLSALFSATFGRTVALAESSRLASIGQFASGIVHEIRTPLATISMALEHFTNLEALDQSTQRRVHLAHAESQRLARLLEDILLYAKPLRLQTRPTRLSQIITDQEDLVSGQQPRLQIELESIEALPELSLDPDRFRQVWLNLIRNAIEANGSDPRGIRVDARELEGEIVLHIRNGGPTIPRDSLEHLFEPFFTTRSSGTGLGLPIVRRIIEAHGGRIAISSDDVEGTCVQVILPTQVEGTSPDQAASSA